MECLFCHSQCLFLSPACFITEGSPGNLVADVLRVSNWRSSQTLHGYLKERGVLGIGKMSLQILQTAFRLSGQQNASFSWGIHTGLQTSLFCS